jgi:tetratricopeptide (TPR) repeat protein
MTSSSAAKPLAAPPPAVAPVVFTERADVRDAVRQELKALGAVDVQIPENQDDAVGKLIAAPQAMLVLDWALGSEVVNAVLGAVRGHFKIETRPIFLIIPTLDNNVIATGVEYGVSQIHSGEISRQGIRECLEALLHEDETTRDVRETLIQVAAARSKGDWAIATPLLQALSARLPGQERVSVELAENFIYENAWDEALALLAPLAELDPPNIRALHLMGRCHMHKGDFDGAVGLLSRAKMINPHNVERLIDLGNAFIKTDQLDEAMANFNEAMTLDSENKDAKVGAGQVMLMNGEVNEALSLLKSVSGPRELASLFNTSAILSMRQGRFDQGMHLYKSALAALGRDDKIAARLMFNMGLGFRRWNKPDKALMCFEKSLALDPTYAKAAKHKDAAAKGGHGTPAGGPPPDPPGDASGSFTEEEFTRVGSVQAPTGVGEVVVEEEEEGGGSAHDGLMDDTDDTDGP